MQVDVAEHLVVLIIAVMEADVIKAHVAAHLSQGLGVGGILDIAGRIHDFAEALDARHAALELLGKVHNGADGGQQGGYVEQIGRVIADADFLVDQKQRAGHHDDNVHQAVKQTVGCAKARHVGVLALFAFQKAQIALGEFFLLQLFIGKGLDHADARQILADRVVQRVDLGLHHVEPREADPHHK